MEKQAEEEEKVAEQTEKAGDKKAQEAEKAQEKDGPKKDDDAAEEKEAVAAKEIEDAKQLVSIEGPPCCAIVLMVCRQLEDAAKAKDPSDKLVEQATAAAEAEAGGWFLLITGPISPSNS